ncbi:methyltransferase domain-containing protein [Microcella daejeonensis]|uniref:methyltransferase domain-containing protein n=1 Tax=Microcella daejeonensis TaxID=2994971 RepID=UPI002270FCDB|nr:methyltransferase domain-containing protein [Microcella daejeonensis]WAB85123.1 methyltransferase domain-containing protein [Microcella daejeonensis]
MQCSYFDAGLCRSCTLMGVPYAEQLAEKERIVRELLLGHPDAHWLPAAASAESGFRAKAKMVVGGTAADPTLGVLDGRGRGVDLRHCGIIAPGIRAAFAPLIATITAAGLEPYDVPARRGELKYVIVTEAADGALMVRFVLRSRARLDALRRALPSLQQALPRAVVVTANLHPDHKAVVEGAEEIVLTSQETLPMRVGDATLQVRPQSFVQTNTAIAGELYRQGRAWVERVAPSSVWDLYCGVGGFALHVAAPERTVTGLELSADAVESARLAADGMPGLSFVIGDATAALAGGSSAGPGSPFADAGAALPDLVIVNPPRRGLGEALATGLGSSGIPTVVYSSCNATTLARDLELMPAYRVREARLFDMFPQSTHAEVMVLLERR